MAPRKNNEKKVITYAGLQKLEEELHDLKVNQRHDIAEKIKEAREHGDLSENAEYDAAKDEQRDIEARIEELEEILKNVVVVDEDDISSDKVSVGSVVKVVNEANKQEYSYTIVGSTEANFLQNKISNESPLGHELMGCKVGEKVVVKAPAGELTYTIVEISK
ncbi:MAG: transcription elongation factor GreA [Lachnospiraceae bacterium]|nr:transcription elongation factor GreA [Clostridia bacterium]MBQ8281422.1 transcription elongation factor GreA [Lachnospiraceae bacterium]